MTDIDDGGPAFPTEEWELTQGVVRRIGIINGMSLRDYFAGMALQGMLSANPKDSDTNAELLIKTVACGAYLFADAMLEERKRTKK
jgi:hypothetical protein